MDRLLFVSLSKSLLPSQAHPGDAWDLRARQEIFIPYTSRILSLSIPTGVKAVSPVPLAIHERSSVSLYLPFLILGGGLIDPGYRGEIKVIFRVTPFDGLNTSLEIAEEKGYIRKNEAGIYIQEGVRIAQILPVYPVDRIELVYDREMYEALESVYPSLRGDKGFGSTESK